MEKVLSELQKLPRYEHYGKEHIYTKDLLKLAKKIGKNQGLAEKLWKRDDVLSAKHLAIRVSQPELMLSKDLDRWLQGVNTWGNCDGFCAHIVRETPFSIEKAFEWVDRESEFERRAGFSIIAQLAWKKSDISNETFISFLPLIEKYADDDRYFVKKAVNWALRDIGKRNKILRKEALKLAIKLQKSDNKNVKWIGTHRIKEIKG